MAVYELVGLLALGGMTGMAVGLVWGLAHGAATRRWLWWENRDLRGILDAREAADAAADAAIAEADTDPMALVIATAEEGTP